jgi:L-aspartate oxidase
VRDRLRRVMTDRVGVVRSGTGLAEAAAELDLLAAELGRRATQPNLLVAELDRGAARDRRSELAPPGPGRFEVANLLQLGWAVVELAGRREESRGGHWRSDHPAPVDAWRVRQTVRRGAGGELAAGVLAVAEAAEVGR